MSKKFHLIISCLLLAFSAINAYARINELDNPTYIIGHWNYQPNSVNPVYVISDGEDVELFINDISNGHGRHESKHLFTFDNVIFQPGTLTAVSYDADGKELGRYSLNTSGVPAQIKLNVLDNSALNNTTDSEDTVIQCEITDFYGKRCLHDNRTITFEIEEPADWANATGKSQDTIVRKKQIRLNKGENCISIKKPAKTGPIKVTASAPGLAPNCVTLGSK